MKKTLFLCLLVIIILTSCDWQTKLAIVKVEIEEKISVFYSEFDTYDWHQHIEIYHNNDKIKYADEEVVIDLLSGDPALDEECLLQATYFYNGTNYVKTFKAKILHQFQEINQLFGNADTIFSIKSLVAAVNNSGFVVVDETGSLFITLEVAEDSLYYPKVGEQIQIIGQKQAGTIAIKRIIKITDNNLAYPTINTPDNKLLNNNMALFTEVEGKIIKRGLSLFIKVNNQEIQIKTVLDLTRVLETINETITIKGFLYQNANNYVFMVKEFAYQNKVYEALVPDEKYAPVIEFLTDEIRLLSIPSYHDLLNFFSIYDIEDGEITPTIEMLSGTLNEGTSIVTISVRDSDNNFTQSQMTIHVEAYEPFIEEMDARVIDENTMPSVGDVKVLVIPVAIGDNPATEAMREVINEAFFGNEQTTGWESLSSYYAESSYGKLQITGEVTPWYYAKKSQNYYAKYSDSDDYIYGSTILMEEALTYFKSQYNYDEFDSNSDGFIDAVYLIYNAPIGGSGSLSEEDFYWAYTFWDLNVDARDYAETLGYSYVFLGYDFFNTPFEYTAITPQINTQTLIHETGHLFNLDDYYDYDEMDVYQNDGGYCGADMMDWNIGDHGPYSKLLANWIEPIIIKENGIYELPALQDAPIALVIGANGEFESIFSEYYLIDYFTFKGLNALEMPTYFDTKEQYAGVRVSLVNATLTFEDNYYPYFKYNNSDTKHKQIMMLEADYDGEFDLNHPLNVGAELTDFYRENAVFGDGYYQSFKSSEGNIVPFIMEVLSCDKDKAYIKITFKDQQ